MKKIWIILSVALLSCACTKTDFGPDGDGQDYGYLSLALSSDNDINQTKAVQAVSSTELSNWNVTVSQESGSFVPVQCTANALGTKAFAEGTYTVSVYNYADDDAACAANSNWGAARYEGSNTVNVVKGQTTPVTVACGTAKNARFKVVFSDSFTAICTDGSGNPSEGYTFTTAGSRNLVFSKTTAGNLAYYAAGATVNYTLSYTYQGSTKTPAGSFIMGAAATEKTITISANNNGTISLTISYDDTFTDAGTETVTIDAATGEVVTQ